MAKEIRERQVANFYKVDPKLAQSVAEGIGVEVPKDLEVESTGNYDKSTELLGNGNSVKESPALSMEINKVETAKSRKVAILLEEGFVYREVMQVQQALTAAGAQTEIISMLLGKRKSSTGEELEVDKSHITSGSVMFD